MATLAQAEQLRRAVQDVNTLAARELLALWRTLDLGSAPAVTARLVADLPELADVFAEVAAVVAADWYGEVRAADVGGLYEPVTAGRPERARVEALARWGVDPLWASEPDAALALSRVSGGLQRVVAGGARDTVETNAGRDPARPRVARHAAPGACAFCAMLATRGPVYRRETVGFKAHDDCRCVPAPVFGDRHEEPRWVADWRDTYEQASASAGTGDTKQILANMREVAGMR